jgi:hypothetical protein
MAAPFSIFAGSPDALAQQENFYDGYYQNADESDRSAYDNAQAQSVQNAMRANQEDDELEEHDINAQTSATENAADNSTNLKIVAAQNQAAAITNDEKQQEKTYNDALQAVSWLPTDPMLLSKYYPTLSQVRINQLSLIAAGVQKDAAAKTAATNQPQVDAATQGAALADAGNRYNKIIADQSAIAANPVTTGSSGSGYNFGLLGGNITRGIPSDDVIQPTPYATSLMSGLRQNLAPQITPSAMAKPGSLVVPNPVNGQIQPAYSFPPGTRPPVILPSNPAVVAPSAPPPVTPVAPSPVASQPVASTQPNIQALRAQAQLAISKGKDPVAVRARFKQLTGLDL